MNLLVGFSECADQQASALYNESGLYQMTNFGIPEYVRLIDPSPPFGLVQRGSYYNFMPLAYLDNTYKSLIVVTNTSSADIGLLGVEGHRWVTLNILDDTRRPVLPFNELSNADTSPVGFAVSGNNAKELHISVLNNEGLLSNWAIEGLNEDQKSARPPAEEHVERAPSAFLDSHLSPTTKPNDPKSNPPTSLFGAASIVAMQQTKTSGSFVAAGVKPTSPFATFAGDSVGFNHLAKNPPATNIFGATPSSRPILGDNSKLHVLPNSLFQTESSLQSHSRALSETNAPQDCKPIRLDMASDCVSIGHH